MSLYAAIEFRADERGRRSVLSIALRDGPELSVNSMGAVDAVRGDLPAPAELARVKALTADALRRWADTIESTAHVG